MLEQLISFKELAITFFPPGNRSKKHSYIRKERAESRESSSLANSTSFPGAARIPVYSSAPEVTELSSLSM